MTTGKPKPFAPEGPAKAVYEQGKKAFGEGVGINEGPYVWARGPFLNAWWQAGWTQAKEESNGK